jgi:PIN domain nuclease of toxin-antitoxin system
MRYLLDSMIWLWSIGDVARLNKEARDVLTAPQNELYLSSASIWEIAIKVSIGRLQVPEPLRLLVPREIQRQGLKPLQVSYSHALGVSDLPLHHGDPFDRLLVAQARSEGLVLITSDRDIKRYPVQILWAGR